MLEKPSDSLFESDGFCKSVPCLVERLRAKKDKKRKMSPHCGMFLSQKSIIAQKRNGINMVFVQNTEKQKDI